MKNLPALLHVKNGEIKKITIIGKRETKNINKQIIDKADEADRKKYIKSVIPDIKKLFKENEKFRRELLSSIDGKNLEKLTKETLEEVG